MTSSWLRKWFCFFKFSAKLKHKNKWIFQQVNERKYRYLKWRMWLLKHFAWKKQGCFVPSLIEIGPVVLKRFLNSSMYFRYFVIISPWRAFIWMKLNPHQPRMHCVKFGWNWSSDSGKEMWKVHDNAYNTDDNGQTLFTNLGWSYIWTRMLKLISRVRADVAW